MLYHALSCTLLFAMYPALPFAPHAPCFSLPLRWRVMALGDTRSTLCNNAIEHTFNYKFKYGNQSSEFGARCQKQVPAQDNNIPSNEAREVGG